MFWPENEKAEVSFWAIVAFSFQIYCQFHAIERLKCVNSWYEDDINPVNKRDHNTYFYLLKFT